MVLVSGTDGTEAVRFIRVGGATSANYSTNRAYTSAANTRENAPIANKALPLLVAGLEFLCDMGCLSRHSSHYTVAVSSTPVSYTHLTLPTIYSV